MEEMLLSFGALVSQLPSDTEVPGLLEDITNKGMLNGLEFDSIELQDEVAREFYIELPIKIIARGSYHDLGAFISGMAGLPRIVTLHDFKINQEDATSTILRLEITAKTYRYKEEEI
jgi:type IV pilus assembly protein PilO